jgi:hypothetical protein
MLHHSKDPFAKHKTAAKSKGPTSIRRVTSMGHGTVLNAMIIFMVENSTIPR